MKRPFMKRLYLNRHPRTARQQEIAWHEAATATVERGEDRRQKLAHRARRNRRRQ